MWLGQQCLRKGRAGALAAACLVDGHVHRFHPQPDARDHALQSVLVVVAARCLVGFEHVRVPSLGVPPPVFVGSLDGSGAQGDLAFDPHHLGEGLHHLFTKRLGVHVPRRLRDVADVESASTPDGARLRSDAAHQRLQQGRLALSVRPDDAHAGAFAYLKGDTLEYIEFGEAD